MPRPPSLHLPAPVKDLSALRVGNGVQLRFTAPDETSDHLPLMHKGVPAPMTAVVCRVQGAQCLPTARLAVSPGQAVTATDTLPPALTVGGNRAVLYRVRVENASGRDAGLSRSAPAVAGETPGPVTGLTARTVAGGIQLTWQPAASATGAVRVEATTEPAATAAAPRFGEAPSRSASPVQRLLEVRTSVGDPGGSIDPAPAVGARVTYQVYRQREIQVNGNRLEVRGAPATVTTVRSADVFPPAAPKGLLAVSFQAPEGGPAVSLSWDPNGEPDVVGYWVYRAIGNGGPIRITQKPVAGISYQDGAAGGLLPGVHAQYTVTAVDRNGNESPRSVPAEVDVR